MICNKTISRKYNRSKRQQTSPPKRSGENSILGIDIYEFLNCNP